MTEHKDRDLGMSVNDQAAEWFIRLKDGDLAPAERRRFLRWLKQSPNHIAEFLRLSQMYKGLKYAKLRVLVPLDAEPSNIVRLAAAQAAAAPHRASPRLRAAAAIGALALASVLGVVAKVAYFSNRIETRAGEYRQFELADGSIVRAGPNTLLRFDFDEGRRSIHLERGKAVFQVAKDPRRPFRVNAEPVVAQAVGTEFGVMRGTGEVTVTVAEGQVAVSHRAQREESSRREPPSAPMPLSANQQVSVSLSAGKWVVAAVQHVDAMRELAWANGQLIFQTETIGDAVEQFNRRNRIQIVVDDPQIASRPACCSFDVSDPESFAEAMAAAPDIALVREGPHVLRLVPEGDGQLDGASDPAESDSI